jgi:hypothetical protein
MLWRMLVFSKLLMTMSPLRKLKWLSGNWNLSNPVVSMVYSLSTWRSLRILWLRQVLMHLIAYECVKNLPSWNSSSTFYLRELCQCCGKMVTLHWPKIAYRKNSSRQDTIFVSMEAIRSILRDGNSAYLSLYHLEKAFDSIEHPILLRSLFRGGVNGKSWRLIGPGTAISLQ